MKNAIITICIMVLSSKISFAGKEGLFEAQMLALEVSGELQPPEELTNRILNDLAAIRTAYPEETANIAYRVSFTPDEIIIRLTEEAFTQFRQGQYHALDELNALYGVISSRIISSSLGLIVLKFDRIYNTEILSDIYEQAHPEGVKYVEPNYRIGDGSTIYADLPDYIFRQAWGDCPSGCIYQKFWHFKVENSQVSILPMTYYVNASTGRNTNLGFTRSAPLATIQVAIDRASDGETVVVAPGTYTGPGNRDIDFNGKAITVRSENGPESCIIDCQMSGCGFFLQDNSIIEGFTVENGCKYCGGTIVPITWHGAGIFCDGQPTIRNCIIRNNYAHIGAGIHGGSPTIVNCLITGNKTGSVIDSSENTKIINCTIVGNGSWRFGRGVVITGPNTVITNSILRDNLNEQLEVPDSSTVIYNNIQGGWPGEENIDADTGFVNPGYWDPNGTPYNIYDDFWVEGDYRLTAVSPCIDSGDPNYVAEPNEIDLDNRPRIIHGRIDMGAYEFNHLPVANAGPNQVVYAWIDGVADVMLDANNSYDADGDELTYLWTWSIDGNTYDTNGVNPTIELPVGVHIIKLVVNDGWEDSEPNEVVITVVEPIEGSLWITPRIINGRCEHQKITAILRLPAGISRQQIDARWKLLLYPGQIEASYQVILRHFEHNGAERVVIFACFDKESLVDAVGKPGPVQLDVVGRFKTGQYFYGSDTVRIINPPPRLPGRWWNRNHNPCVPK